MYVVKAVPRSRLGTKGIDTASWQHTDDCMPQGGKADCAMPWVVPRHFGVRIFLEFAKSQGLGGVK